MIITTGFIPHEDIAQYYGIVSGSVVSGIGVGRDWIASIKDFTGGRVGGYEQAMEEVKDKAISIMQQDAQKRGADAVMMVRMNFEVFSPSEKGTVVGVIVYGTAVRLKDTVRGTAKDTTKDAIQKETINQSGRGQVINHVLEEVLQGSEYESNNKCHDRYPTTPPSGVAFDWKK